MSHLVRKNVKILDEVCIDVLLEIFLFVPPSILCTQLRRVSKKFREVIESSQIFWKKIVERENFFVPGDEKSMDINHFELFIKSYRNDIITNRLLNKHFLRCFRDAYILKSLKLEDIKVITKEQLIQYDKSRLNRSLNYGSKNERIIRLLDSMLISKITHWSGQKQYIERNRGHDVFSQLLAGNYDSDESLKTHSVEFYPVGGCTDDDETHPPDFENSSPTPWKEITKKEAEELLFEVLDTFLQNFHPIWKFVGSGVTQTQVNVTEEEKEFLLREKKPMFVEDAEKLKKHFFTTSRKEIKFFLAFHVVKEHIALERDWMLCAVDSFSVRVFWYQMQRWYG